MTACVKNHSRRVALAISASLVGALSLGAATVPTVYAQGIETQSATEQKAWEQGEVAYAYDNNGVIVTDPMNAEFVKGSDTYLVPVKVMPKDAMKAVEVSVSDMTWHYDANNNGVIDAGEGAINGNGYTWQTGTYLIKITAPAGSGYAGDLVVPFKVVAKSLSSARLFDGDDISDSTFIYTGKAQEIGVLLDGIKTDEGSGTFDIQYYQRGSNKPANGTNLDEAPTAAGDYTARLVGGGDYAGSVKEIDFTVEPLELSTANVTISDLKIGTGNQGDDDKNDVPGIATVNGVQLPDSDVIITVGSGTTVEPGARTATVTANPLSKNVTGAATATYNLVTRGVLGSSGLLFKGAAFDGTEYVLYLGTHATHIDMEDFDTISSIGSVDLSNVKFDVHFYNEAGEEVSLDTVNSTVGTYIATMRVNAEANNWEWGSSTATMTIKTRKGTSDGIDADANLTFTWNGAVAEGDIYPVYDGEDVFSEIGTTLRLNDEDGTVLEKGSDYQVTAYDANGVAVDEIVDAGNYTVVVSSDSYEIKNSVVLNVHVKPFVIDAFKVGSDDEKQFGSNTVVPYDGQDHDVYFSHYDAGEDKETRLPDGVLELDHFEYTDADGDVSDVEAVNGVGSYRAYVTLADGVTNYVLKTSKSYDSITVSDKGVFTDVPGTHYAAEGIYNAYAEGYMNGYKGTTFFGPDDPLNRAQAAVVLFNMGTNGYFSSDETSEAYLTLVQHGLAFPDAEQWYAGELGWAAQVGVVEGYPDGTFGGGDAVTREQFATMLRNYAEAKGEDVSVSDVDAVLAGVEDADTISGWAREAVAWAVENGVMGSEGYVYADQGILRGQAALMVTRFQPEALKKSDLLINGARS